MRENAGAGPTAQGNLCHASLPQCIPSVTAQTCSCLPRRAAQGQFAFPVLPHPCPAPASPGSVPFLSPAHSQPGFLTLELPSPAALPSSSIPTAPFQTSFSPGFSVPSSPSPALAQPGGLLPLPMPPRVPTPPPAPELQALAPGEEQAQSGEGCTHHCQPGSASGGLQGEQSWVRGARTTHYRAPPTSPPGPAHSPSSMRAAMP